MAKAKTMGQLKQQWDRIARTAGNVNKSSAVRQRALDKLDAINKQMDELRRSKYQSNPASKVPLGKFLPVRFNPNGTITVKLPRKRKPAARKKTARKRATKRRNPPLASKRSIDVDIRKIPLDRQGYTKGNYPQYYGVGEPLYGWEINDSTTRESDQGEMRAQSKKEVMDYLKRSARYGHYFKKA